MDIAELETAISTKCTEGFTDTCFCGRKYFWIKVYFVDIAELE
ncbi:hypothetical protein IMSAGC007_01428 [Lachnospiraceae bacterium]|nr:hypothetical protein IMSAGC007_01428 [Lachnospiraceae bacterium]